MRNIFFILFFAANLFAQVPGQDVVRDCFYATPYTIQQYRINDPKGMQLSRADYEDSLQSGNPLIGSIASHFALQEKLKNLQAEGKFCRSEGWRYIKNQRRNK